ncbi:hypothetical protein ZEAMMB73_Zm00001d025855 [Zea mays]|uniref:Uncharacterized protein n=1 Tax=Zea mays TaxID=4577 RepID=A0A1D6JAG3_MAIZE|nr:hypothetical protein ZEAMMB73_Zm00001d025855 [Zea mays]
MNIFISFFSATNQISSSEVSLQQCSCMVLRLSFPFYLCSQSRCIMHVVVWKLDKPIILV